MANSIGSLLFMSAEQDGNTDVWAVYGTEGDDILSAPISPVPRAGGTSAYGLGGNDALSATNHGDFLDGGDGNDYLVGNGGSALYGGGGDDSFIASFGYEPIWGSPSSDYVSGGAGIDSVFFGIPAGTGVSAWFGKDSFSIGYEVGRDYFSFSASEVEYLNGKPLQYWIEKTTYGTSGNDVLSEGSGLFGWKLAGLQGDDTYRIDTAGLYAVEQPGEGRDRVIASVDYYLGDNIETLQMVGKNNLRGWGNQQDNYIGGNSGSNDIDGGGGADVMVGGRGNDSYYVDDLKDQVIEQLNEGIDHVHSYVDFTLRANIEDLTLLGGPALIGNGNELSNHITGNVETNVLKGGGGNDYIKGSGGGDQLFGGDGDDILNGESDLDSLTGGAGADDFRGSGNDLLYDYITDFGYDDKVTVVGASVTTVDKNWAAMSVPKPISATLTSYGYESRLSIKIIDAGSETGTDIFLGGNVVGDVVVSYETEVTNQFYYGEDTYSTYQNFYTIRIVDNSSPRNLIGTAGSDILNGARGNDVLDGRTGADVMTGGQGNDVYHVDNAGDRVVEAGGEGYDRVVSTISHSLTDNVESLQLISKENTDAIGNALANYIGGNSGNNVIDGRAGADKLYGGAGSDTFVFHAGEANGDLVGDFTGANTTGGDSLLFVGYGAGASLTRVGNTDSYLLKNGDASFSETIKIAGIFDLVTNSSHDDILFV